MRYMTVKDILDYVDEIKQNSFSRKTKLIWLNELEYRVQTDVMLLAAESITYIPDDDTYTLLVPAPWSEIYYDYLLMKLSEHLEESSEQNNRAATFDKAFTRFMRWWADTYRPANGNALFKGYYLKGEDGAFRVNVTYSGGVLSADKTFDEIKAAYNAGQQPYVVQTSGASDIVYTLAGSYLPSGGAGQEFISFERYLIFGDTLETVRLRIFSFTLEDGSNIEQQISPFNDENVKSAELDEYNMVSFKNADGIVLFTLDLSELGTPASYGNLVLSAESLTIEEGGTGGFTVALDSAPSANQIVYLAVSDNTRLTVSPVTLTFTPANYAEPQTVTVTALQDEDEYDDTITVTLTSRKVDAKQLLVSIVDDDKPVLVEDGLYCNLNFRNRVSDNGDGGDHSIVNSVDGTAYTVNNMLFDGENDGFHAKGLFFRPPSAFSNYNQYNATTFGSVQLFSTDDFYGGKVPQDSSQDFHITIEVTGTLCQHLTESSKGIGEVYTFCGYQPCECGSWLLRGTNFYVDAISNFYNSAGETDSSMRVLASNMNKVIRNGEIVLLRSVLDFLEEHTFTVVIGPGTKRLYVDGEALCNAEGETVAVGENFQYYHAQYETNKWFFGSSGGRSDAFPQYWAHFRVYKRELNADEVLQNYRYDVSRRVVSTF